MLLLPAQYTWSAAAVYCQHEQNSPFHFGHHAHQHQVNASESKEHGKVNVKSADADCEYCHMFSHAFFLPFDSRPAAMPELRHVALPTASYTSFIPMRPPRPNWQRVA